MTNNVPYEFPCEEVAAQYSFPTTKLTDVIVGRCMKEVLNGYVTNPTLTPTVTKLIKKIQKE
jgi:hypothetical protein